MKSTWRINRHWRLRWWSPLGGTLLALGVLAGSVLAWLYLVTLLLAGHAAGL